MAKTKDTSIRVVLERYPNGEHFYKVMLGRETVGAFDLKNGVYVPFNCRKGFVLMQDAAREVVWKQVQRTLRDGARLSAAFALPVTIDAVDPVGEKVTE